jgi:L-iditol 2-dehydrogenase
MRQAHLTAPRTLEWRDTPVPTPGPGEVLVGIRAALTCGTDLKTYRRGHPKLGYGPFGHEAAGDVVAVGLGVERFAPGDAIMWVQTAPCGSCNACLAGSRNLCERLFDRIALGAYGDRLLLPSHVVAQNTYRKPAHLSYIEAAFLEPFACIVHGWNVLRRASALRPMPDGVAIVGAGTIGLLHLLFAVKAGVRATVIARGDARKSLAQRLGAADIVDADDAARIEKSRGTFDAVIECAGTAEAWQEGLRQARPGGRVLFFSGLPSGAVVELDATRLHYAELTCLGSFHFTPADVREAYELLAFGGIDVKPLVSGVEPLDRLADVFERLDRREGHKFALIPGGGARWV